MNEHDQITVQGHLFFFGPRGKLDELIKMATEALKLGDVTVRVGIHGDESWVDARSDSDLEEYKEYVLAGQRG